MQTLCILRSAFCISSDVFFRLRRSPAAVIATFPVNCQATIRELDTPTRDGAETRHPSTVKPQLSPGPNPLVILRSEATKDLQMRRCEIKHLRILRSFVAKSAPQDDGSF